MKEQKQDTDDTVCKSNAITAIPLSFFNLAKDSFQDAGMHFPDKPGHAREHRGIPTGAQLETLSFLESKWQWI